MAGYKSQLWYSCCDFGSVVVIEEYIFYIQVFVAFKFPIHAMNPVILPLLLLLTLGSGHAAVSKYQVYMYVHDCAICL